MKPGDADSTRALELLIAYRRAELDGVVRELEQQDTKAAWVIASSLAVGSFAATGFGAIGVPNVVTLVLLVLGAILLLASALLAFAIRDTAVNENFVGRVMRVLVSPMRADIGEIPALRGLMRAKGGDLGDDDEMRPDRLLHEIARTLHRRLEAAKRLSEKLNAQGRRVILGLTLALGFLSAAAIAALTTQNYHHPTTAKTQIKIVVAPHVELHGSTLSGSVTDSRAGLVKFATDVAANALGSAIGGWLDAGLNGSPAPTAYLRGGGPFMREMRAMLERIHLRAVVEDRDESPSRIAAPVDCPHYYLELDALSEDERDAVTRSPAAGLEPIARACGFRGIAGLDRFSAYLAQH